MTRWLQSAAIGLALLEVFCVAKGADHSPSSRAADGSSKVTTSPTYTRDIAPILFRSCAPCHRPGEAAPFSLLTYADAKSHARLIEELTKRRLMPPWLPAADDPKFADDLRLSDEEISRGLGEDGFWGVWEQAEVTIRNITAVKKATDLLLIHKII